MYNSINNSECNDVIENSVVPDQMASSDLYLQCFQNRIYTASAGQSLN